MADDPQYVYNFAVRPLILLGAFVVILLLMRWVFTPGGGIVPRKRLQLGPPDYGLLVPVATTETPERAVELRDRLAAEGIRATLAPDGVEVLVFTADADRAREVLA